MERTDFVRSAALGIWVRTGSSHESDDNSGVSHFIEHMMFKGTDRRSARQIAEDVDRIGGMSNAFTGKEATCYYIKTLSSNIYQGAEILLDMLTGSAFAEEEMDKERKVILEEIKMIRDTPDEDVIDLISELVNGKNAIGRTILGTPESLAGIDRQKLASYYRREYSRDSIVIAVAGNFDPDRIEDLFEKGLGSLNADKPAFAPEIHPYEQKFKVRVKDIEQTHLCLAIPSVPLGDDRYYAFVLMNSIFGGSMSSRLFQNIRERKGLAYSVFSASESYACGGQFYIYAAVKPGTEAKVLQAIGEELSALAEEGISEEQTQVVKQRLKSGFIFSLESTNSRMYRLGKNMLLLERTYTEEETMAEIDAVSREQVNAFAKRIADIRSYSGAAISPRSLDWEELWNGSQNLNGSAKRG